MSMESRNSPYGQWLINFTFKVVIHYSGQYYYGCTPVLPYAVICHFMMYPMRMPKSRVKIFTDE